MMLFQMSDSVRSLVSLRDLREIDTREKNIRLHYCDGKVLSYGYETNTERDVELHELKKTWFSYQNELKAEKEIEGILKPTKDVAIMGSLKDYFNKHRDAIYTLGIIVLVDHFIFGGAFREKIKATVESMLDKVQKGM